MKIEDKATERPWKVPLNQYVQSYVMSENNIVIAKCENQKLTNDVEEANAKLIVKCVNMHDELVEIIKDYITNLDNQSVSNKEMKDWLDNYLIPKMRQALQKSGEL